MLTMEQRKERSELAKKLGYGKWMKGRRLSAETRAKIGEAHKNPSLETIQKRRESRKGYTHSLETREKISKSNKGRIGGMVGKHHSIGSKKEIGAKNRERLTGRTLAEEVKNKITLSLSKYWRRPENRQRMSEIKKGFKHSEETKKRLSESRKGEKNPAWRNGKSFEFYTKDWTKTLRESIRKRDGYVCQICGKRQGDIEFDVHHIDYNKKNCNPENLITLCRSCHQKTGFNREFWTKILTRIIGGNKWQANLHMEQRLHWVLI